MGIVTELRETSRLGLLVSLTAATLGIIYGYDRSNIVGALLFTTDVFGLSTQQQEMVATAVAGEVPGALVATVFGIILCPLAAWVLAGIESWRWMLGLAVLAAVIPTVVCRLPDTPRWYVFKGRLDRARKILAKIDPGTDDQAGVEEMRRAFAEESGRALGELPRKPWFSGNFALLGLPALVTSVLLAAAFLTMLHRLGGSGGTFTVFGALAVAAWLFVYRLAPEAKGRNLEDIRHYWETGAEWPEEPENHLRVASAAQ